MLVAFEMMIELLLHFSCGEILHLYLGESYGMMKGMLQ